ncbi:MAG: hypothetical protein ACKVY0_23480 [Prosthecobacter sp.]|uniref:hypothetical protein n=1 Tax=Prosthecobacter sp. TaxID=1965333 RepID=UPI003903333A
MKASRCSTACAMRALVMLSATLVLCQCSMPSRQAWQYIKANGLVTYWNYESQRQSPPLRTSTAHPQRYAATRSSSSAPRYGATTSLWSSWWWGNGTTNRVPYSSTRSSGYSQNRYYSAPSSNSGKVASRSAPRKKSSGSSNDRSPSVNIPLEEPSSAPQVVNNNPPASKSNPSPTSNGGATAKPAADMPYGTSIPGRVNMVNSPYAGKTQLVDVSGMTTGQTVKCPYTGKLFKVPPSQQAAASKTEPRQEPKVEAPSPSSEPKPDDKKP